MSTEKLEELLREELIDEEIPDIETEQDYVKALHEWLPQLIREKLEKLGFYTIAIYHLKEDRPLPEYVVVAEYQGKTYTISVDIDYSPELNEFTIVNVEIDEGEPSPLVLVYYHQL